MLADALTSVAAIVGLVAGKYLGWIWMDAAVGILGAIVITHWSVGLARSAARSLLDSHDDQPLEDAVRERLRAQDPGLEIHDLHLWRIGPGHHALMTTLRATNPLAPEQYKLRLAGLPLSHVTIEVEQG